MPENQTDRLESEDHAEPVPEHTDVGVPPPRLARRPHVEKPKERARIRPDAAPAEQDDEADQDDGDDEDADDEEEDASSKDDKKSSGKQKDAPDGAKGGKTKKKGQKQDDQDEDEGKDEKDKGDDRPIYRKPVFWIGIAVLVVGAIVGVLYWLHARDYQSTDDAFIEGHVVQISPQVSARVLKVYIDDNSHVNEGDPLVDLDPIDYQVALAQAKGQEASAQGKLEQAKANVESSKSARDEAKANVDAALTQFENAERNLKRFEALDDRARSKQQLDDAATQQKNNAAQVNVAKAKLASAESQISVNVAMVAAAQGEYETNVANRKRAEVNLGYCHITAEATGRITSKNVDPGSYVSTGAPMFAIVRDDVWVVANYKETQLTDMRVGQPVTIKIDAYPDYEIHGRVESFQSGTGSRFSVIPAENATGNYVKVVQRLPVKIVFDQSQVTDKNHVLAPGMSVVPYVKIR